MFCTRDVTKRKNGKACMKVRWIIYLKNSLIVIYTVLFTVLILFQIFLLVSNSSYSILSYLYWLILLGWIYKTKEKKLSSDITLRVAFILSVIAVIFHFLGLRSIGETIMRIGFIGWIIGFAQAIIEYREKNSNHVEK